MGDLIDRQAALKEVREAYENDEMFDGYEYRLNELPSTEIILCRECKFGEVVDNPCFPDQYFCNYHGCDWNRGNHYCGYAERMEETNEVNH